MTRSVCVCSAYALPLHINAPDAKRKSRFRRLSAVAIGERMGRRHVWYLHKVSESHFSNPCLSFASSFPPPSPLSYHFSTFTFICSLVCAFTVALNCFMFLILLFLSLSSVLVLFFLVFSTVSYFPRQKHSHIHSLLHLTPHLPVPTTVPPVFPSSPSLLHAHANTLVLACLAVGSVDLQPLRRDTTSRGNLNLDGCHPVR